MPEAIPPKMIPEISLDQQPLKEPLQSLEEAYALSLVTQTFNQYEQYRTQACDRRWNTHDSLYTGYTPQKVWDGTNIPRSSLTKMMVFDHVETALPAIDAAVFSNGTEWFQVEPEKGAGTEEARAVKDYLLYAFERNGARKEINLAIKSTLLYGNGGLELFWDAAKEMCGVQWIDIRDFYIDPACSSPSVDECRSVIRRRMMTISEVKALAGSPNFSIPSDETLYYMAQKAATAYAENTKRNQEGLRGVNYTPQQWDNSILPSDNKLEVLIYYSPAKIIWVLDRSYVAYNENNPFGFIPFCFAPCFTYLGRFYAISYADVLENPQRYAEALMNGHLDEVNIALHPPRVSKRGGNLSPTAQRWRPGLNIQVEDSKDVQLLQPQPATVNVMEEVMSIEVMAERHTGVNSIGMGIPRPGNANRTVGGIQAQQAGGASRLAYLVKNIEDYMLVPLVEKAYKMTAIFGNPSKLTFVLGQGVEAFKTGLPSDQPLRFKMLASSQMLTREKIGQVFQFTTQYLLQGPLVEQLHGIGMTVDSMELFQMMQDATGTAKAYRLIRPFTEEEKQSLSQPSPEVQAKMAAAQQEAQTRVQMGQLAMQKDLQLKQMDLQGKAAELEVEREKEDEESAREMLRLIMAGQVDKTKAAAEVEKGRAQVQVLREKAQLERDAREQKMFLDALEGRQKLAQQRIEGELASEGKAREIEGKGREGDLRLQLKAREHEQRMKQMKERVVEGKGRMAKKGTGGRK